MLSKKLFREALEEIENVFAGFNLTEDKIKIWYKYSKHLTDNIWKDKIKNCIKGCRRVPTLADILDLQGYYIDKKELDEMEKIKRDKEWQDKKERPGDFTPIPKKIKEQFDNLFRKWKYGND